MWSSTGKRPSPALIVAAIAMTFALIGTSVAADPVAKVSVKKAKKIAKREIKKAAPNLSVSKAKTADSATSAANAINADNVGGFRIAKFSVATTSAGADQPLAEAGGLRLAYGCNAGGTNVDLTAGTATDNARISLSVVSAAVLADGGNASLFRADDDFDTADQLDAAPGAGDDIFSGQLTYHAANGTVVTAIYRTSEDGPQGCVVDGTLTFG